MSKQKEIVSVPVWVKKGNMRIRRDHLDGNDPDHTYNYMIRVMKIPFPENYGVEKPYGSINTNMPCPCCGRDLPHHSPC